MFGQNPIRKIDHAPDDGRLAVQEVFYTIQGEGPYAGRPAIFIRLAGCHLACTFCDTEFESGINNRLTPTETARMALLALPRWRRADSGGRPIVVMTGGEPLRQKTGLLVQQLLELGFTHIQYETAGNLWDESLTPFLQEPAPRVSLVVSPKTAHVHAMIYRYAKHWKYIVREGDADQDDGLPIRPTQKNQPRVVRLFRPWDVHETAKTQFGPSTIWISPCDAHEAAQNAANMRHAVGLCLMFGYRLSLQTHKIIGVA